ncbi:MAG: precorrin-3B C(17)-methyltransferase [Mariprofundaceae bacterium]|nr:precorrin-3B C(17)-methyltransferase [Mariprofundaceae bacterium]
MNKATSTEGALYSSASPQRAGEKVGKILLVGFGPGGKDQMTFRARAAIEEADVVIGYTTYIKLVQDLLEGKEIIRKGMTEEIDRCVEAYESAKQGKVVALISSGDVGVYGMAGPTYEVLFQHGWTPDSDIQVEVVTGATALNACASLVGAPLTHDFCSISLSDLLTPWTTIRKRIDAVGSADFVIALYNPKSGRRTQQIVEAQRILLLHRHPKTPVAIVKSAYRRRQAIQMTTLDDMADKEIGMLTTVIIGNSSSYMKEGLLITPRGYANKYDDLTGEARDGEKAGRSLTMGLEGWYGCVRRWLDAGNHQPWEKIATHFDVPVGEILEAVTGSSETGKGGDESAGGYTAVRANAKLNNIIQDTRSWGKLRAVIRSPAGAVTECLLTGDQLDRKGDWLNVVTDTFHIHVNWANVHHAYLAKRGEKSLGAHFVNAAGDMVFRLLLVKEGDDFNPDAIAAFEKTWKDVI